MHEKQVVLEVSSSSKPTFTAVIVGSVLGALLVAALAVGLAIVVAVV